MAKKFDPHESRKIIVLLKIYFDRARMYLGYINFFMLNLVLINSYDDGQIGVLISELKWLFVPILILFYVLLLLLIGYLDTKLGFRQEEMRNNAAINPIMQHLIKSVEEINKNVKKLDQKVINEPE